MATSSQLTIFGPPGTGKTTTLLRIVEKQLAAGVAPEEIAFVSFTKKAADEARDRAVEQFGLEPKRFKYFRTIHSLAFSELQLRKSDVMGKSNWDELGELCGVKFTGHYDSLSTMGQSTTGDKALFYIGLARARGVDPRAAFDKLGSAVLEDGVGWSLYMRIFQQLEAYKVSNNLVDFTDMLQRAVEWVRPLPIKVAIVDEAQDLSYLQWQVIDRVFDGVPLLYIAGDDDQAIFEWSGGAVAEFQQRALRGPIQILDQSYRLPELIWRYSHALSGRIRKRQAKTWQSRGGGGDLSEVGALAGIDFTTPGSWMVLSRTKYGAKEVADLLGARGIPHTLFGSDMVNPRDILAIDAWERLQGGRAVLWEQAYELVKRLRPAVVDTHAIKKMDQYSENDAFTLEELRDGLGFKADITRLWYDTHQQDFKLPTSRVALYRTLINGGWDLHQPSRVHINTMHGVKGGEADHVVLLPSLSRRMYVAATRGGNADDEHRVHYVAATRARQSLRIANVAAQYRYPYPRVAA